MRYLPRTVGQLCLLLVFVSPALADSASYWAANAVTNTTNLSAPVISAPYTCVTNYYISTTGNDSNNGNAPDNAHAWFTIQHSIAVLTALGGTHGGVCVNVAPGIYTGSNYASGLSGASDTAAGYLVFRSSTLHGATVQVPVAEATGFHDSFRFDAASFVIVDGFNLVGQVVPGSIEDGFVACSLSTRCHHIKVINNVIHDHGGAGVQANRTDYFVVQGNLIYNNAHTSAFEVSGISTYQQVASDSAPGFHSVISQNILFNNAEISNGLSSHTDGNGIIIDDLRNTQNGSTFAVYPCQTLVENNLAFVNGGSGIRVYLSDNVTVRNNTTFGNFGDNLNFGTWRGEISVQNGANNTFVNNIAVANPITNLNNRAFVDASTNSSNIGNVWQSNIAYNGAAGQTSTMISGSPSAIDSGHSDQPGVDPLFVSPQTAKFMVQSGSPAIGRGSNIVGIPAVDLLGAVRPQGSAVDIGAYGVPSQQSSRPPAPTGLTAVVQ